MNLTKAGQGSATLHQNDAGREVIVTSRDWTSKSDSLIATQSVEGKPGYMFHPPGTSEWVAQAINNLLTWQRMAKGLQPFPQS